MIIGGMFFFLMRALGEMLLSNLQYKSFIDMAHDLIGPGAGYYIGWSYWLGWVLVGIADLAAIINYLNFWLPEGTVFTPMGQALISAACVLLILGINLVTVKLFGEIEFWFALIKILAIIGLIFVGGYMVFSGFKHQVVRRPALVMSGQMGCFRKVRLVSWQVSDRDVCFVGWSC